jgi:uncharacterized protein YlxW (UPF0749 family)
VNAPAPGRQRSLGASLLDQVLAETLDPAYAQAAAARQARNESAAARPGWWHRSRGQLLVALTLLIAGLLTSVAYSEAAAGAQGREQARQGLRDDIAAQSDTADDLSAQLDQLTREAARTRQDALAASEVGQRALDRLSQAEQAAAVVAVSGPGLRVTLGNAPPAADSDPVGGSGEVAGAGIVQDGDLQLLVNGLWAAGAEAISIDGQRIGATTAIRQAGQAILVDLHPVTNPYEVSAIGDRDDLARRFVSTPEAISLAGLTKNYGVVFEYAKADRLKVPAGTAAELRSAQPLDPATDLVTPDLPTDGG